MNKIEIKEICQKILEEGIHRFPVQVGIVSRIFQNKYENLSVISDTNIFKDVDIYDLDSVYCRDVYKKKKTIAITEIDHVTGMKLHPLYDDVPQ